MREFFGRFKRKHYFMILGLTVGFSLLGLGIKYFANKRKYDHDFAESDC